MPSVERTTDRERGSHTGPGIPLVRTVSTAAAVASVAAAVLVIPAAVGTPGDAPAPASLASNETPIPAALVSARITLPTTGHARGAAALPADLPAIPAPAAPLDGQPATPTPAVPQDAQPAAPAPAAAPGARIVLTAPLPDASTTGLPAVAAAAVAPAPAAPAPEPATPVATTATAALAAAMSARGTPYRWGATGKGGFDCSGLTQWAYRKAGVTLPRTSRAQSGVGTAIAKGDLRPGDLVFFNRPVSHVGIYVGDGNVVHAPQTGDVVKVSPLSRMRFAGARRL